MAFSRSLQDLTLGDWLDELATSAPAPGAGAALGQAVAAAASIVAMAARASESAGLAAQADALRARTLPLADLSAETYAAALAVRESTESLKPAQRDWQIGQAFARAA